MNKNQKIVIEWLSNSEYDFMSNIIELNGDYQSISEEVYQAYEALSEKEKIEVVKKAATNLLKK